MLGRAVLGRPPSARRWFTRRGALPARWLWPLAAVAALLASAYAVPAVASLGSSSAVIADAAALRPRLLDVAAAADAAIVTGDASGLEAAIAAVTESRATLDAPVRAALGSEGASRALGELDLALAALVQAAREYAANEAEAGAGNNAFAAASSSVDALLRTLAERGDAATARLRLLALGASLLLVAGLATGVPAAWHARERAARLRSTERSSRRRLQELARDLPELVFETDARGVITFVSEASRALLGRAPDEMVGRPLEEFAPEALRAAMRGDGGNDGGDALTSEAEWRHADGSTRHLRATLRATRDQAGAVTATRGVVIDISERLAAERSLRQSEERFRSVLETSQNGIMVVSAGGRIELCNGALARMLGYTPDEMQGLSVGQLVPAGSLERVSALLAARMWGDAGASRYQQQLRHRDGSVLDVELSLSEYREQGRAGGVLVEVRDVTESKRAAEQIRRLADYDALTGLPNRGLLSRRIEEAIERSSSEGRLAALLMIGLDRFKLINGTLGHSAGDELLREVAARLRGRFRGHTVARFGGDEFALLAPEIDRPETAGELAAAVLAVFEKSFRYEEQELRIAASIGVSVFPNDGESADTLLRHADTAMRRAKELRSNAYEFYSPALDTRAQGRLAMENALRGAVARNEFVVYFQPLIDAASGAIVSAEALVRWQHPERGLVPPSEFIPLLEDTGLILPVGEWVLRSSCARLRAWRDQGLPHITVSVNLSTRQLLQPDLVQRVERVLAETRIEPASLELEITESAAMENEVAAVRVLQDLRSLGVATSLDDFGTGHSSLSRLKSIPVRTLKVDRSFVSGLETSSDDRAIVGGVIALGHALGLHIVAEGVETEAQLALLRSLGCDTVQGFLFAHPLPDDAFRLLLAEESGSVRAVAA